MGNMDWTADSLLESGQKVTAAPEKRQALNQGSSCGEGGGLLRLPFPPNAPLPRAPPQGQPQASFLPPPHL